MSPVLAAFENPASKFQPPKAANTFISGSTPSIFLSVPTKSVWLKGLGAEALWGVHSILPVWLISDPAKAIAQS